MATVTPDTPDYQRGVVSAQKLVGTATAGSASLTVGVPPNSETLLVIADPGVTGQNPSVQGVSSGAMYPASHIGPTAEAGTMSVWAVAISPPVDDQVTVSWGNTPNGAWYAIVDQGIRQTTDAVLTRIATDVGGAPPTMGLALVVTDGAESYVLAGSPDGAVNVIPQVPVPVSTGHPSNEVTVASTGLASSSTTLLGPPGAGKRYRIFSVAIAMAGDVGSGGWSNIADSATAYAPLVSAGQAYALTFPGQGVPTGVNEEVAFNLGGTSPSGAAWLLYTTEDV